MEKAVTEFYWVFVRLIYPLFVPAILQQRFQQSIRNVRSQLEQIVKGWGKREWILLSDKLSLKTAPVESFPELLKHIKCSLDVAGIGFEFFIAADGVKATTTPQRESLLLSYETVLKFVQEASAEGLGIEKCNALMRAVQDQDQKCAADLKREMNSIIEEWEKLCKQVDPINTEALVGELAKRSKAVAEKESQLAKLSSDIEKVMAELQRKQNERYQVVQKLTRDNATAGKTPDSTQEALVRRLDEECNTLLAQLDRLAAKGDQSEGDLGVAQTELTEQRQKLLSALSKYKLVLTQATGVIDSCKKLAATLQSDLEVKRNLQELQHSLKGLPTTTFAQINALKLWQYTPVAEHARKQDCLTAVNRNLSKMESDKNRWRKKMDDISKIQ